MSQSRPPSAQALENEERDRRERDAAAVDDTALVEYLAKWQRRLRRLQRSFPERWRVPGLSDEEVSDRLALRLLEAIRTPAPAELELRRPGKEWALLIARLELRSLRKSFGLGAVPSELGDFVGARHCAPTHEERWLELETERTLALAGAKAEAGLSRPQRRWLLALKRSARAGAFFEASAEPNLSAAARLLGKNRSSAQRSYRELQLRFGRELERLR